MSEIKNQNSNFFNGFTKAAMAGEKALQPLASNGKMVGNKPTSMVATVGAFKPTPIPTADPSSASHNLNTNLPPSDKITNNVKPKSTKGAPGEMHL